MHKKLYIIGNGFDIYHGIPSRYSDFKNYLAASNRILHGHVIAYLSLEENWCDLEAAFAYFDVDSAIEEVMQSLRSYSVYNWSGAFHYDYQFQLQSIVDDLSSGLKAYFCQWIALLETPDLEDLSFDQISIDRDGAFLTFNYTRTLEEAYGIDNDNVLHIHGESEEDESKIILGHSWSPEEIPDLNDFPNPDDMDTRIMEGNELVKDYFGRTFKSVDKIVREKQEFFGNLKQVEKIFVLGHSLSKVDLRYFEEVLTNVCGDAEWVVTFYDDLELKRHEETIERLGISKVRFCGLNEIE